MPEFLSKDSGILMLISWQNYFERYKMINKETAYLKISELVERFGEQFDSYKNSDYNETLTRRDFIDPFFSSPD
jgi:hypothetical protein